MTKSPWCLLIIVFVFFGSSLVAQALDITTLDGTTYHNCEVTSVETDALLIRHRDGSVRVVYEKLPEALKRKYFDPAKIAAYRQQQEEARKAAQAKAAAAQREREEAPKREQQKQQAFVNETHRIEREERSSRLHDQEMLWEAESRPERVRLAAFAVAAIIGTCLIFWFAFTKPGPILVLLGMLTTLYFWFVFNTNAVGENGETEQNPALVQKRRTGAAIGVGLSLAGVVVSSIGQRKRVKERDAEEEEED